MFTLLLLRLLSYFKTTQEVGTDVIMSAVIACITLDSPVIIELLKFIFNPKMYMKSKEAQKKIESIVQREVQAKQSLISVGLWSGFDRIGKIRLKIKNIEKAGSPIKKKMIRLKNSFLLAGSAGVGKSTLLRSIFIAYNRNIIHRLWSFVTQRAVLYLPAKELLEDKSIVEMGDLISAARFRCIYIICDGLDECGDTEGVIFKNIKLFHELYNYQHNGRLFFIVGCREESLKRYEVVNEFSNLFSDYYRVCEWSPNDIRKLLIKSERVFSGKKNAIRHLIADADNFSKLIQYSPLQCKMFCMMSADASLPYEDVQNQYKFYYDFLNKMIMYELQRLKGCNDYKKEVDMIMHLIAKYAYEKFRIDYYGEAIWRGLSKEKPLIHGTTTETAIAHMVIDKRTGEFFHHTYSEFFVSYYYVTNIEGNSNDIRNAVSVLSCLYSNEYADFISDGIKSYLSEGSLILDSLIRLLIFVYYFTLPDDGKLLLRKSNMYEIDNVLRTISRDEYRINQNSVYSLDRNKYLYLKYEITFRVGRLSDSRVLAFLNFVYNNDTQPLSPKFSISNYELAILKRQCAISSSLLCGYALEIDYVRKMLPDAKDYIPEYDLVNRSHTLIYYGDVAHTDILRFRDDALVRWGNARKKRIERLKKTPFKYDMNDKISCFRLFDLATLYTFFMSRKSGFRFTQEELDIIKNCEIEQIKDMPIERIELLRWIKNQIINISM